MSGITTTIQKLGPTGRVEREVEVTEVPTDRSCETCNGTGVMTGKKAAELTQGLPEGGGGRPGRSAAEPPMPRL